MACWLVGTKPLYEALLEYFLFETLGIKRQWNIKRNSNILVPENGFENVM